MKHFLILLLPFIMLFASCDKPMKRIDVIFDTDTNNELDDQHALAYLLFSDDVFNIRAITINATRNGGDINEHCAEAERIIKMCGREDRIKPLKGANDNFEEIREDIDNPEFDGHAAVDCIINEAIKHTSYNRLVIIAVGKLTNIALALEKEPTIADNIRIVWLGSNYPAPGEYNLISDISSMNYVIDCDTRLEIVPARYNEVTGTDFVRESIENIRKKMPGLGPRCKISVTGRHGDSFNCFGDYSVNLFEHVQCYGNPPSRALFDMAAVAIVKNPSWAETRSISAPIIKNGQWIERPDNKHTVILWENFKKDDILKDFYSTLKKGK